MENQRLNFDAGAFDEWRTAAFSSNSGPSRRPVAMLSFAAQSASPGLLTAEAARWVNIAIHLLNGLFVYLLSRLLAGRFQVSGRLGLTFSALAALLWLGHPLHVSTVLYPVQRMAQLSSLFVLIGLWCFARCRLRWAQDGAALGELVACAAWLGLLTALGTLSKENGALLPWLVLVVEVCVFRGDWRGTRHRGLQRLGAGLLLSPLLLVLFWFLLSPETFSARFATRNFELGERLLTQLRLLWHYVGWLLLPEPSQYGLYHDDLVISRRWLQPWTTALAGAGWLLALVVAWIMRARLPVLLFALLFYLVGHSMESSFLPLEMVFEHRNYLPSVGLCIFLAWLLVTLGKLKPGKAGWLPTGAAMLIVLGFLFVRVSTWSDGMRLAQVSAVNHPLSERSLSFYADEVLRRAQARQDVPGSVEARGRLLLEARHYYELAYGARPDNLGALIMLLQMDSQYFSELGTRARWLEELLAALERRRLSATDHNALETLMRCLGKDQCGPRGDAVAQAVLGKLQRRYPGSQRITLLEYEYLVARDAPSDERIALLRGALAVNPDAKLLYTRLMADLAAAGQVGAVYELARDYQRLDTRRWQMPLLKGLFVADAERAGDA